MGYQEIWQLEQAFDSQIFPGKQVGRTPQKQIDAGHKWAQAVWDQATQEGALTYSKEIIEQGLALSQEAVYLCGVERSGTTLLRNLLDNHSQLSVLPSEGTYYTHITNKMKAIPAIDRKAYLCQEWLWRLVTSDHQPPFWLLGRSSETTSAYVDFARAFISWWEQAEKHLEQISAWPSLVVQLAWAHSCQQISGSSAAKLWVDKTPRNEMYLQEIWQSLPKAKVIYIARNPVAIINSRKRMDAFAGTPTKHFIKQLRQSLQTMLRMQESADSRLLVLRYEDLVAKPTETMQTIANFIGINYEAGLLVPTIKGQVTNSNSSFATAEQAGSILLEKSKQENMALTQAELALLYASVGKQALAFGYEMPSMSGLQAFWIRLKNGLL
ncbi:MAG: hypothetical protein CFE25_05500 [Chitinophagaceae bacterium BSSC1]|nr:MAG: hypothetical protein CFE25_05500 [Chitinophagaceae bacterium BSSC1]